MNDTTKIVKYGHGDRYSIKIQHNNDRYDCDKNDEIIDHLKEQNSSVYKHELVPILSCVSRWPEFKIRVGEGKSGFDRPDLAVMLFQLRMEAMKKEQYTDGCSSFQDSDGQISNNVDSNDIYSLPKLKTRKICSMESAMRTLKFVNSNNL